MKNMFFKFFFSKIGLWLTPLITSGVAVGATKLATLGVEIPQDQQIQLAGWLSVALVTIAQGLLINKAATATKQGQRALGDVEVDGVLGDETLESLEQTVVSPARKLPKGYEKISGAGK